MVDKDYFPVRREPRRLDGEPQGCRAQAIRPEPGPSAERFLAAPEELVEGRRQSLSAFREQRRSLAADLDALRLRMAAVASLDERVEATAAKIARLAEVFGRGDPTLAREALRGLVERIELWFSHSTKGNVRRTTTFAKGLIYVRPDCLPTSELINAS
jgi:hypothetical protein